LSLSRRGVPRSCSSIDIMVIPVYADARAAARQPIALIY
jgi:hypothetical protein